MNQPEVRSRTIKPERKPSLRQARPSRGADVAASSTDVYMRGLEQSRPLTREEEAELGRRIERAERDALSALVRSRGGERALAAIAEEISSGKTNARDLLLNSEAPDAARAASRLASVLEAARAGEGLPEEALAELEGMRLDPAFVTRLDGMIAVMAEDAEDAEREALEAARARSAEARLRSAREKGALVQANLRLVVATARRYVSRGVSLLDLVQEGNLGLLRAADKFDHARGFKFGTYAAWWIRQSIERGLLYQSKDLRMPVHLSASRRRVLGAERALTQQNGRAPSMEEIAERADVPLERVLAVRSLATTPISLEAPMSEEGDHRFGDTLASETEAPDEEIAARHMREATRALLEDLSPRERAVLEQRYGLVGGEDRTLEEIGRSFSLSRERIRQIEAQALQKLRALSKERGLGSYLEGR